MQSIKEIRESKRLSQVEVARRLGIDTQNYHRLEKRGKKLSIEQLESISDALEVSVFYTISTLLGINEKILEKDIRLLDKKKEKQDILFTEQLNKIDSYANTINDLTETFEKMKENINKRLEKIERNNPK